VVAAYTVLGVGVFVMLSAIGLLLLSDRRWRDVESYAALTVALVYAWFLVFLLLEAPRVARDGLALIMAGTLAYAAGAWWKRRHAETVASPSSPP
jgi:L-asparagine transporter-like permease